MAFTYFKVREKKVKLTFEFGDYTCIITAQESNFLIISKGFYHVFIRFTLIRQKKQTFYTGKIRLGAEIQKEKRKMLS